MIPVIIMAGGMGERLGELTNNLPKPMVDVAGEPYIRHLINQLIDDGFERIIVSAGYKAEAIVEYITELNLKLNLSQPIEVVIEPKKMGSGGGARYVMEHKNIATALVVNGDVYLQGGLDRILCDYFDDIFLEVRMGVAKTKSAGRYGRVIMDGDKRRIIDIKEKDGEEKEGYVNAGIYLVSLRALREIKTDTFDMGYAIMELLEEGAEIGYTLYRGKWFDIGTKDKLEEVRRIKKGGNS